MPASSPVRFRCVLTKSGRGHGSLLRPKEVSLGDMGFLCSGRRAVAGMARSYKVLGFCNDNNPSNTASAA